jgi:glycosyltransferase involved in cell wall biosynthesis
VIAWGCGSVPEIVDEGETGYIVNSEDEAMSAVTKLADIDRNGH